MAGECRAGASRFPCDRIYMLRNGRLASASRASFNRRPDRLCLLTFSRWEPLFGVPEIGTDAFLRIKMRWERLLSRLLMAVTLLVAALSLAPTGALAHAGHDHAVPSAAPSRQRPARAQVVKVAPMAMQDEVSVTRTGGVSASLLPTSHAKTPQSCPSGCCNSAGTGCCALWLPPSAEVIVPALGRLAPVAAAIAGSGITPGALPEPPKPLV
jgi:hypothetical protein